jgi:hypothetical protein
MAKNSIGLVSRKANNDHSPVMAISRNKIFKPLPINRKIITHAWHISGR